MRFGFGDADLGQQVEGPLGRLLLGDLEATIIGSTSWEPMVNDRVQVGHRLLRDVGHLGAPQPAQLLLRGTDELLALEDDRAAGDVAAVGQQRQHRQGRLRLAGPGLADQPVHLAAAHGQRDVVHHVLDAAVGLVVTDREVR